MSTEAGKQPSNMLIRGLTVLAVVIFIAFVVNIGAILYYQSQEARYQSITSNLRVYIQQTTQDSKGATDGDRNAFQGLAQATKNFDDNLRLISKGDKSLDAGEVLMKDELLVLSQEWKEVKAASETIVTSRDRILLMHDVARTLSASIPELQQEYSNVVEVMLENKLSADQVVLAQRQSLLAQRISHNVDRMLQGTDDAKQAADQFNLDASTFGNVLQGMLNGNAAMGIKKVTNKEARQSLDAIAEIFRFVSGSVDEIFQASPDLLKSRQAGDVIAASAPRIVDAIQTLSERVDELDSVRFGGFVGTAKSAMALIAILLALVLFIGWQMYVNSRHAETRARDDNERNEQAILRLLDELDPLSDGDLTTTATVTEDMTGAIADAINNTVDQLRVLVSAINDTAVRVSDAADETRSTALHLAEASENQAQEIAGASAAVNEMAITIDQVSSNASESAQVAERSVDIAKSGAEVVQNTIKGMDTIREQIQDTSKRIKRLGESSQEIGDIVSLINDIADQTNILALNAAIQASMAGDAGRGFAVVADEVQRLAERSGAATKQIEALVKTIQSDTNEAVISMEQTTAEVVRGARLAQDAGVALEEIESVSANLAELIQNISNAAKQQAASAAHISNTMNVIQEITSQTSAGTTATAQSIGNLAELANNLRGSVAGFRLPDELSESDTDMAV